MLAHVKTIMTIFCIVSFVFARYLITIGDYNCISWLCAAGLHCLLLPNTVDFSLVHFFTFSLCLKMLPPPPLTTTTGRNTSYRFDGHRFLGLITGAGRITIRTRHRPEPHPERTNGWRRRNIMR